MRNPHVLLQLGDTTYQRLVGIARYAHEHGWYVTVDEITEPPRGWKGDGVLMTLRNRQPRMLEFARRMMADGVPIVDFSICHPELRLHRVIGDHIAIGRLAAEHFRERRFGNVAFFSSDSSHVVDLRYGGFARAWGAEPPRWIWRRAAGRDEYGDHAALSAWLSGRIEAAPKPLAIFAFKDSDAARALNACTDLGLDVPEEVAILGVDDYPLITENQVVPLSSIRHDMDRIGYEGAALLDRLMRGGHPSCRPIQIPPIGITERRSTQTLAVGDPLLRKALSLIERNLGGAYGVEQLADDLGIGPHTLRRRFEKVLSTTPAKEFGRVRIARAKLLLADPDIPIKTIATDLGFCNVGYFSNVFAAAIGEPPSAYRARTARARC